MWVWVWVLSIPEPHSETGTEIPAACPSVHGPSGAVTYLQGRRADSCSLCSGRPHKPRRPQRAFILALWAEASQTDPATQTGQVPFTCSLTGWSGWSGGG